ncbi:MAG: hypothetical protein LBN26_03055 [Christensenellaceae bacterium]|jgi:cyclic beta-1,2-glucan synthetase|nr:hypothetical protein [Christensenellaceae bacterium]
MLPNRSYYGLIDIYLDAEELRNEAVLHSQMRTSPRPGPWRGGVRASDLQLHADRHTISGVYRRARERALACGEMPPALETLLDDYYVAEKAMAATESCLRELWKLPALAQGEHVRLPRVYDIAVCLVGHRDGRVDEGVLARFLDCYQLAAPLTMRELAALPNMLRIALIKLIALECANAAEALRQYEQAEHESDALRKNTGWPGRLTLPAQGLLAARPHYVQRLYTLLGERDEGALCERIVRQLAREDQDAEELMLAVCRANERGANRLGSAIKSLRALDAWDWDRLLERFSRVDEALRQDATYAGMDARSRAYYRDCVERLSARLNVAETVVARQAAALAKAQAGGKRGEAGYYLLLEGQEALYAALRPDKRYKRLDESGKLRRFWLAQGALLLLLLWLAALAGDWRQVLLAIVPGWSLACAIATKLFLRAVPVRMLPRLALAEGIPAACRTLVTVPTLITGEQSLRAALEQLEVHMLASRLEHCHYAVLGDFADADAPQKRGEQKLLRLAEQLTKALNEKYSAKEGDAARFYYLHRRRELNRADGLYMGRERKRGALCDLVRLLRGEGEEAFCLITSPLPKGVRYCLTLDADTVLPPGSLKQLIGAMAHPLAAPKYDARGLVCEGYGVIAPRMQRSAAGSRSSAFAWLAAGACGLDSYFPMSAEFYQDVFYTGNFGGKGIFDVEAFAASLLGWIPDNTVLSHDLLEGCFLRAGYAGDIAFMEGEPSNFVAWWKRQHRWTRGDWQLLPFLAVGIRDAAGILRGNPLSALSRYKIWDNFRRTLLPGAALLALLALPALGVGWYAALALLALLEGFLPGVLLLPFRFIAARFNGQEIRFAGALWDEGAQAARAGLDLLTLPYSALRVADAQIRTLYRVLRSHRHMLQWQTAAQVQSKPQGVGGYYRALWIQPALGGLMLLGLGGKAPVCGVLLGLAWLLAPVCVRRLDRPHRAYAPPEQAQELLRDIAARTWRWFDAYANEHTNYLPPDNVQVAPPQAPVRNTSPTNIGMGLMACVCARDLGLITDADMALRIGRMLSSLERMEMWNGHLYNWYRADTLAPLSPRYVSTVDSGNLAACLLSAGAALEEVQGGGTEAARCRALVDAMDFRPLYDAQRRLFCIGFDVENGQLSRAWYDLLASEARLTSLVAVAQGQVELEHWFRLGRQLTPACGRTLLSWSGTMFEYLMPVLFTGQTPGTLLHESCKNAVRTQIRYAGSLPWGISESGYYAFDRAMYYQYRAFGVPRLSLMAQRERTRVVAPYATLLALGPCPEAAVQNLRALISLGALEEYGMIEALDFTPARAGEGKAFERVRSYMAHHQGMSLCALTNALCEGSVSKRFMALPQLKAVRVLLEEKPPAHSTAIRRLNSAAEPRKPAEKRPHKPRRIAKEHVVPEAQLLSNGRYTTFITDSGLGFSKCGGVMLGRWRPDYLRADSGVHILLRCGDAVYDTADAAETVLHPHKAEFNRQCGKLSSHVEVCVCAQHDAEVRAVTLANHGEAEAEVEMGVFMEVCLAGQAEDVAHPAFVRLTVRACAATLGSGGGASQEVMLFERRRAGGMSVLYALVQGETRPRYETDRLRAQGRGKTLAEAMLTPPAAHNNPAETVDPYFAARAGVRIPAGQSATLWFVMGYAESRTKALSDAEEVCASLGDCADLAWAHAQSALRFAGLSQGKAELFERIAARLLLQLPCKPLPQSGQTQGIQGLWRLGVSGDAPILLMRVTQLTQLRMARSLVELIAYMAARGCAADLILLGEYPNEYRGDLRARLGELAGRRAGVHLLHGYALAPEDRALLLSMAMMEVDADVSLDKQFAPRLYPQSETNACVPPLSREAAAWEEAPPLAFYNGLGGFDETGEYVIALAKGQTTPLPWCNILANEGFGTLVSESGGGYTWGGNSREGRLTPWYNEPVTDQKGEFLLLCDAEDGAVFSPLPGRLCGDTARVRHGYGYTSYRTAAAGLRLELTQFVHTQDARKYSLLTLHNPAPAARRVRTLYAVEWALGDQPRPESLYVRRQDNVVFAQNLRHAGEEPAYIAACGEAAEACLDRTALLHAGWNMEDMDCGGRGELSALRCEVTVPAGGLRQVLFLLGQGTRDEALRAAQTTPAEAERELARVRELWRERLDGIRVQTPNEAMNLLLNGRLLYQVYASRLFARGGYYQSGGAIGFRDQLQDMLALLHTDPARVRAHLLTCAARQFEAGDVLHWWHAPYRGVRTYIADDRLFLPYVLAQYLEATQDWDLLNERAPYLEAAPIPEGARDLYAHMQPSGRSETLYQHCCRAILSALRFGSHGLPLMEGGDWNDGMDLVGGEGGESVWLGWFLLDVLRRFIPLARRQADAAFTQRCELAIQALETALEEAGWDGAWYRRAYFADGKPLGAQQNDACSIDCLSQAWAAICGAAHGAEAMDSLHRMLVDEQSGILRLLTPPFTDPEEQGNAVGYITAYLPGVRENGGQYTHGAAWAVLAECALNRPGQAQRLFDLLNPIEHARTYADALRYKTEPYAVAGDVYAPPNGGRGGWSWYTGAAGWLYTIALEHILGVRRRGSALEFAPCTIFESYTVRYRFGGTVYALHFKKGDAPGPRRLELVDDGGEHEVEVIF